MCKTPFPYRKMLKNQLFHVHLESHRDKREQPLAVLTFFKGGGAGERVGRCCATQFSFPPSLVPLLWKNRILVKFCESFSSTQKSSGWAKGRHQANADLSRRLCGGRAEKMVVTSRSSTMTITFRSDASYVDQGFYAEFKSFVPTNRNAAFGLHPGSSSRSVSLTPSSFLIGQLVLEASSVTTTCASTKRCSVTAGTTVGTTAMRTTAVSKTPRGSGRRLTKVKSVSPPVCRV